MTSILLIDNYDSFVYNIAQYLGEMGASVRVERNDSSLMDQYLENVDGYIISPGPGHPRGTRRSLDVIQNDGYGRPLLGVCLGHQAIAFVRGGNISRADRVVHGKVSKISHDEDALFEGVPNPFSATRYHSLIVDPNNLPDGLEITAKTDNDEIMAIRVRGAEMMGVQFHPESVLTSHGRTILSNFLRMCRR